MDYEQRYKEALDEAKAIHKTIRKDLKPVIEQIFPELKESEDERIRKELIKLLRNLFNNYSYFIKDPFYTECINWLEKQGKQEITDKVEPKFNLYDWVVTDKGDVVQIGAVNNGYYTLFNGMDFNMSYVDKCWHRWTIQDAKDGDVLRLGGVIAIFKKYIGQEKCICYCSFCEEGNGFEIPIENGEDNVYGCTDTTPATKEQRDTLFEEMKLEGYRWDEDKKKVIQFERFVRRKESNFDFEEDKNGVIKFVHKS